MKILCLGDNYTVIKGKFIHFSDIEPISMISSHALYSLLVAALSTLTLISCAAEKPQAISPDHMFPATSQVAVSFDENAIPDQCRVFSHLMISVPPGLSEKKVKKEVEGFGMSYGADYILVGMARESDDSVDALSFKTYGPRTPYLFKTDWHGWKFGFRDWNSAGQLIDYGHNRTSSDAPAFDTDAIVQAILLSCQLGPSRQ